MCMVCVFSLAFQISNTNSGQTQIPQMANDKYHKRTNNKYLEHQLPKIPNLAIGNVDFLTKETAARSFARYRGWAQSVTLPLQTTPGNSQDVPTTRFPDCIGCRRNRIATGWEHARVLGQCGASHTHTVWWEMPRLSQPPRQREKHPHKGARRVPRP